MDGRLARVKIELDLLEGKHFPESNSKAFAEDAAALAFVAWLETFFTKDQPKDLPSLNDYIQVKILEN
jgi:hypothetical protein